MSNVNTLPVALYFQAMVPSILSSAPPDPPSEFDIFCFFDASTSMGSILTDPAVTIVNSPAFSINLANNDMRVESGGSAPNASDAFLSIDAAVSQTWTIQFIFEATDLPVDFSDLVRQHLYIGNTDQSGVSVGLFISTVGAAYAPLVNLSDDGDLVLDGPFQPIPGTSSTFQNGVSYTVRMVADKVTNTVYLFATETDNLPFTGHRLIAILPAVYAGSLAVEGATVSVRGTATRRVAVSFDQICLGTGMLMPNIPPRADAGRDQAIRACTVGVLDGSASFDPDGGALLYQWRLVDAPLTSSFAFEGADGFTVPEVSPSGFSDKFYSAELGSVAVDDNAVSGDVLLVNGMAFTVVATGVDGTGYYVQFAASVVADDLVNATFKLLRQRALSNADTSHPAFLPDVSGIYRFDLIVYDGQYFSEPSVSIVNVLDSQVPRGCIPDLGFVWGYLSDFWNLVEDRERIQVFWESLAQVTASELLNLWQVDYSKSLRDVQRQFQRKWLHYDLKLAEPLPELTALHRSYGGLRTALLGPTVGGLNGTKLVVNSPAHATGTLQFQLANPYAVSRLYSFLLAKLQEIDPRYEVTLAQDIDGANFISIVAPFRFSIDPTSTSPLFSANAVNQHARGTLGQRITPRVYKVERSLAALNVQENDLVVIGEEGYLVSRVVDDPIDQERFMRVVVQTDLPLVVPQTWSLPSYIDSRLLDFYNGQVSQGDVATLELLDSTSNDVGLAEVRVVGACEGLVTRLGIDLGGVDFTLSAPTSIGYLAFVLRRSRLPVGDLVVSIPLLQQNIKETDDSVVLRNNVDFFVTQSRGANSLRFMSGRPGDTGDVWQGSNPPVRLWAETTYLDNRPTIESNFGLPAELTVDQLTEIGTDTDYLSAVRGLWYTLINGPTMFNLRAGTQILLGLPFAEEAGYITEIRTDFSPTQGRVLVRDAANEAIVRSYSFPKVLDFEVNPATGAPYVEGDFVRQFAPIITGAEVLDYVKRPDWFQGILNQGIFFEVEKFHKFIVRVDSDAFNLSALLFVQTFIKRVKPTYTSPMFVVTAKLDDTEVDTTDEITMAGHLILNDGACFPNYNISTMVDQYRPAGGGSRNKVDTAADPSLSPPTFPTPTFPITWGVDKNYLCPEDEIVLSYCVAHAGGVVPLDSGFKLDGTNAPSHHFTESSVATIEAGPVGHVLPGSSAVTSTGNVESARIVITGVLDGDPGNYELLVYINAVLSTVIPFTVGPSGFIGTLTTSIAVTSGQTLTAHIRPGSGGARTPIWPYVEVTLGQHPLTFAVDTGLPAGTYCYHNVV